MFKLIQKWFSGKKKKQPEEKPKFQETYEKTLMQAVRGVGVSDLKLSAEKNVVKSCFVRCNAATLLHIREYLFKSGKFEWKTYTMPGDVNRYYDQETRERMILECIEFYGAKK